MPLDKEELEKLVDEEIERKFKDFKETFIARIRKPAIGIIVAIAALVALAGIYVYIDAASKVYESRAELARARTDFYESMMDSQKEVLVLKNEMIQKFNDWAEDAEQKMILTQEKLNEIQKYDEEFQAILERHKKAFRESSHHGESLKSNLFEKKDSVKKLKPKEEVIEEPEEEIFKAPEPEPVPEREQIKILPALPEQKSYRIDPDQMQQRTLK